ncbi:type 4 pilus major pilin [Agrobacterium salinitolerans]|nr:type 4 pilus major pilin [Agrobacterium salinitolerans]
MISKFNSAYARKLHKTRKRGATLMEMVAWLALAAMIIAGALVLWNVANSSRQTTTALTQLNQIQTAVRTLYSGQSSYVGLSTAVLVNSKALQQSMISGTAIRHAYNGAVTVAPATTTGGGANSGFTISFANIPQDACQQMLTKDLGRGLYEAGVGTMVGQPNLPFTLVLATGQCSGPYNTVKWTFI